MKRRQHHDHKQAGADSHHVSLRVIALRWIKELTGSLAGYGFIGDGDGSSGTASRPMPCRENDRGTRVSGGRLSVRSGSDEWLSP